VIVYLARAVYQIRAEDIPEQDLLHMPDIMELLGLGTILCLQVGWNEAWQFVKSCKCYTGDEFGKQLAA
jgi:hypothetical protein